MNEFFTIFCDIDGTVLYQPDDFTKVVNGTCKSRPLAGSAKVLLDWHTKGYQVILVTGRPECMKETTERQLKDAGIIYDKLIMGVGSGPRILINDMDPKVNMSKADAVNVKRNQGLEDLEF